MSIQPDWLPTLKHFHPLIKHMFQTNVPDYAFCRKNKTFSSKLAKTVKRPSHTKHCQRLGDSTVRGTSSTKRTSSNSNEQFGIRSNRSGSRQHVEKRGNKNCYSKTRADLEQHFCASKKRGKISTNYKSKTDELLYSLPSFQDGGVEGCEEYSPKRRFSLQTGPERCLLFNSSEYKIPKVCTVPVEREPLRVSVPSIWIGSSPKNFYKTDESSNFNTTQNQYSTDYLSGRHAINGSQLVRNSYGTGLNNVPFTPPRLSDQFRKIDFDTTNPIRIFRDNNRQPNHDVLPTCGEDRKTEGFVSGNIEFSTDHPQRTVFINREVKSHSTCYYTSPSPIEVLTTSAYQSPKGGWNHYETSVGLTQDCIVELKWWINNLHLQKGKPLNLEPPEIIIQSDAATSGGWGATTKDLSTGGTWTKEERKLHINILELMAVELAVKTFTRNRKVSSIHLQIDNTVALSYLMKMGGTKSWELTKISKRIWHYLLDKEITLTAEWIPTQLNIVADWESRYVKDSTEWKLSQTIFQKICKAMGTPNIDLFASRVSHQVPTYLSLKADPCCQAVDAFQQNWNPFFPYAFPPFCLISKVLRQLSKQKVERMILVTPLWPTQPWYPLLLSMCIQNPILIPTTENLLENPLGEKHPLILNSTLELVVWLVSGIPSLRKAYRAELQNSLLMLGEKAPGSIMSQPGKNDFGGVVENRLIPLNVF